MFICTFSDGSTFTEKNGTWNELPDKQITGLSLTLPVFLKRMIEHVNEKGEAIQEVIDMPSPIVGPLTGFDKYYFANQDIAVIFQTQNGIMSMGSGQGKRDRQIIAGIDETHNLVVWIEVDTKANVVFKRFPIDKLQVRLEALRRGYTQ